MDKSTNTIKNLLIIFLSTVTISLLFIVFKYIGVLSFLSKISVSLIPVCIAILTSFLLEPLIESLIKRNIKRTYAVLIIYTAIISFIIIIFWVIVPIILKQVNSFFDNIPNLIVVIRQMINSIGINVNEKEISAFLSSALSQSMKNIFSNLSSSVTSIFNFLLGISGSIFLSFDFLDFKQWIKNIIPRRIRNPVIFYFKNFLPFIHKYFFGMLIDSAFILIFSLVLFAIFKVPYSLILAIIISITNLIPIIGPYIGGVPAVVVGFSNSFNLGIVAFVLVVVIQFIESNFIQPIIMKNKIKLHPVEGILGISLFGTLFGVSGMILSPILIVGFKTFFIPYK